MLTFFCLALCVDDKDTDSCCAWDPDNVLVFMLEKQVVLIFALHNQVHPRSVWVERPQITGFWNPKTNFILEDLDVEGYQSIQELMRFKEGCNQQFKA